MKLGAPLDFDLAEERSDILGDVSSLSVPAAPALNLTFKSTTIDYISLWSLTGFELARMP